MNKTFSKQGTREIRSSSKILLFGWINTGFIISIILCLDCEKESQVILPYDKTENIQNQNRLILRVQSVKCWQIFKKPHISEPVFH